MKGGTASVVPNPYRLLAAGLALALAGWGGYRHGVETERDACAAAAARVAHTAAESARADAALESDRRQAAALQHAQDAAAARESRLKGQLDALRETPRPDCGLPAGRLHNYNAAIDAANAPDAPHGLRTTLPTAAQPGQ